MCQRWCELCELDGKEPRRRELGHAAPQLVVHLSSRRVSFSSGEREFLSLDNTYLTTKLSFGESPRLFLDFSTGAPNLLFFKARGPRAEGNMLHAIAGGLYLTHRHRFEFRESTRNSIRYVLSDSGTISRVFL